MTDHSGEGSLVADTLEGILRHIASLRAVTAVDEQLIQLLRMVDSATWSTPVPLILLVDGTTIHGVLVPGEVSAAYLDNELFRLASDALSQLGADPDETVEAFRSQPGVRAQQIIRQARGFVNRIKRQPFASSQSQRRQRNANALVALDKWHQSDGHDSRLSPLEIPGDFTSPDSPARDVIPYMTGQPALTLTNAEILVNGEWLSVSAPLRVAVSRIGAWTMGQ